MDNEAFFKFVDNYSKKEKKAVIDFIPDSLMRGDLILFYINNCCNFEGRSIPKRVKQVKSFYNYIIRKIFNGIDLEKEKKAIVLKDKDHIIKRILYDCGSTSNPGFKGWSPLLFEKILYSNKKDDQKLQILELLAVVANHKHKKREIKEICILDDKANFF